MNGSKADEKSKAKVSEGGEKEQQPMVDAAVQGALGRKLRESYEEVVREEVPGRFLQLLEELKQKEKGGKGGDS